MCLCINLEVKRLGYGRDHIPSLIGMVAVPHMMTRVLLYSGKVLASIKFGELALSRYWWNLNLVIWILGAIGMHAIVYIGEFLIWWPLLNSLNHQIKNLTKVSRYTVYCEYYQTDHWIVIWSIWCQGIVCAVLSSHAMNSCMHGALFKPGSMLRMSLIVYWLQSYSSLMVISFTGIDFFHGIVYREGVYYLGEWDINIRYSRKFSLDKFFAQTRCPCITEIPYFFEISLHLEILPRSKCHRICLPAHPNKCHPQNLTRW